MTNIPPSPMSPRGILKGDVFSFEYPFVFIDNDQPDPIGSWNWKPGIRYDMVTVNCADGEDYESEAVADAMGKQVLTIIDIHKPGKYPTRVFYTRQWIDPNGEKFGKNGLRIATASSFKTLLKGFRYPYKLVSATPTHHQVEKESVE